MPHRTGMRRAQVYAEHACVSILSATPFNDSIKRARAWTDYALPREIPDALALFRTLYYRVSIPHRYHHPPNTLPCTALRYRTQINLDWTRTGIYPAWNTA